MLRAKMWIWASREPISKSLMVNSSRVFSKDMRRSHGVAVNGSHHTNHCPLLYRNMPLILVLEAYLAPNQEDGKGEIYWRYIGRLSRISDRRPYMCSFP